MADYKAMYLDAMERAIETLTAARQRCEDLYVATSGKKHRSGRRRRVPRRRRMMRK